MNSIVLYIFVFLLGSIVGSFMNVCIYRMPRKLSIVLPSSRCPSCNTPIKPWDNIPIVSYIFLGGRCRVCKSKISLIYPLVEFLNAVLYVFILWRFGFAWHTFLYFIVCSTLVVISFIDLEFQIIPDKITLPGIPIGIIIGSFFLPDPFMRYNVLGLKASLQGFVVGGGVYYALALVSRGGMGGGDIKMMAMVGALMGWKAVLLISFIGSFIGSLVGIFLMIFKGKGRKTKIPFGPFLALGSLITLFYGEEILYWFLHR
jgi:leader peptidase (prepilin peptidase)/N-methyltransferase